MAVIENRATEDGDIISIQTDVPIVGIVALTSFSDATTGETGTTYFQKTFRYSINGGLTFTDWIELTTLNIQNIVIEKINYFVIEYRYKRIGVGSDIGFTSVDIAGTLLPLDFPIFGGSMFSPFFTSNNVSVLGWALNVLEKLYKNGIIPNYITRNTGSKDDSDYIAFWFSITHFFAVLVYYARGFENIAANTSLMREYVKGRGVYMRNNPDIEELLYVYANYINEIKLRGTKEIYRRGLGSFDISADTTYYGGGIGVDLLNADVDGELVRLLNTDLTDECLVAPTSRFELGWCIGQSSPLYTGADNIENLIKAYEYDSEVVDISRYPLIEESYLSVPNQKIQIANVPDGLSCGIGSSVFDLAKAVVIDPSLSYEISFKVLKQTSLIADLSFGVALYDMNGTAVSATQITDGTVNNRFFTKLALKKLNTEYWVRGVLNASDSLLVTGDTLNIGFGQNLRSRYNTVFLIPLIIVENSTGVPTGDIVSIWDIKIRPASLWFSRGLLSSRNFILGYLRNRSADYSDAQVKKIIDEQLIPYNSFSLLKFL
jgi:hypothetical protein